MNILPISFDYIDEDKQNGSLKCPACGRVWVKLESSEAIVEPDPACPHLLFHFERDSDDIEFFNGFTKPTLIRMVEPAARVQCPDLAGQSLEEYFWENHLDRDFWQAVNSDLCDTLVDVGDSGVACGPISYTVFFGARLASG